MRQAEYMTVRVPKGPKNKSNREHQASRVHNSGPAWHCKPAGVGVHATGWLIQEGGANVMQEGYITMRLHGHGKPAGIGVHAAGWLIQKHDCRAAQEGNGYTQLASLPTRQISSRRVQLAIKPCA